VIALLVGLVFHELSHALVANALGDPTPRLMGRISLNPLRHLDPIGTLLMLTAGFGWAKPVQVTASRLRNGPVIGMATVAAAGPISNFVMAALFALPLRLDLLDWDWPRTFSGGLPGEFGRFFRSIEPYGIGILFVLFMVPFITGGQINPIGAIMSPIQDAVLNFLL
jgi:Zn-dependent protease